MSEHRCFWLKRSREERGLMVFVCQPCQCQSTAVRSDAVMNMEKQQQLYPSQTQRMAQKLMCYILLGSKGKQGYWDNSVKLRLKNRQGITQVMGSLAIYHWHVTQNSSVGSDWWRFVFCCGLQWQHCLVQQKNVQFYKLSTASSLSPLFFITQQQK